MKSRMAMIWVAAGIVLMGLVAGRAQAVTVTLSPTGDASIRSADPNANSGSGSTLTIYHNEVGFNVQQSVLKFDLASLQASGRWAPTIHSAKVVVWFDSGLFNQGDYGKYAYVYRLTQPWVEPEVSWTYRQAGTGWTTPGGTYVGTTGIAGTSPYASNTLNVTVNFGVVGMTNDVTALVQEWVNETYPNNGLILVGQDGNCLVGHSREAINANYRPFLIVDYTPGPKALTATLAPAADNSTFNAEPTLNLGAVDKLVTYHVLANNIQQAFLQFDVASLSKGGWHPAIYSAKLVLWRDGALYDGGDDGKYTYVYRVTQAWAEAEASWNNRLAGTPWATPGGDYVGTTGVRDTSPYASNTLNIANGAGIYGLTNDVTTLVSEWVSGTNANCGLAIVGQEGNGLVFHSREATNTFLRPVLTVIYEKALEGTAILVR